MDYFLLFRNKFIALFNIFLLLAALSVSYVLCMFVKLVMVPVISYEFLYKDADRQDIS